MMTKSQLDAQIARHREQIDALCADLAACNDRAARIEKAARDLLAYVEIDLRRDREGRRFPRPGLGVLADDLRSALEAP